MDTAPQTELEAFRTFVDDQLRNGGRALSPEECLDLWRAEHPPSDELRDSVRAITQALADMEAGDTGRPLVDVVEEIRGRHNLPRNA